MAARIHKPLSTVVFNANGILKISCELSKQVQSLHRDVDLLQEAYLKPHVRFFIPNYYFYRTGRFPGRKQTELP
jgi:hypothetical protein